MPTPTPSPDVLLVSVAKGRPYEALRVLRAELESHGLRVAHWVGPDAKTPQVPPPPPPPLCVTGPGLIPLIQNAATVVVMPTGVEDLLPLVSGLRHATGALPPRFYPYFPTASPGYQAACPNGIRGLPVTAAKVVAQILGDVGREVVATQAIAPPTPPAWEPWVPYLPETMPGATALSGNEISDWAARGPQAIIREDIQGLLDFLSEGNNRVSRLSREVLRGLLFYGTEAYLTRIPPEIWTALFRWQAEDLTAFRGAALRRGGVFAHYAALRLPPERQASFADALAQLPTPGAKRLDAAARAAKGKGSFRCRTAEKS